MDNFEIFMKIKLQCSSKKNKSIFKTKHKTSGYFFKKKKILTFKVDYLMDDNVHDNLNFDLHLCDF